MNNPSLADYATRLIGVALNQTVSGRWVHPLRGVTPVNPTTSQINVEISGKQFTVTVSQRWEEEV